MSYQCLIVDDEKLGRDLIKSYLTHFDEFEVAGECHSALQAMPFLAKNSIDVLFLDVNMPQMSGIDLLKQQSNLPLTVLCTAYSEYALASYDFDVVDYLLKPIDLIRFSKTIAKISNRYALKQNAPFKQNTKEDELAYFFVQSDYKKIKIEITKINYIEAVEKYIHIHCSNQKVLTLMSMSKVMDYLPEDTFLRIHRSYIINKHKIQQVERNRAIVADTELPISRANRKLLSDLLKNG